MLEEARGAASTAGAWRSMSIRGGGMSACQPDYMDYLNEWDGREHDNWTVKRTCDYKITSVPTRTNTMFH